MCLETKRSSERLLVCDLSRIQWFKLVRNCSLVVTLKNFVRICLGALRFVPGRILAAALLSVVLGATASAQQQLRQASELLSAGKFPEAEAVLRKRLSAVPNDHRAKVLLGVALDQQGRSAEAEKIYRDVLKARPNDLAALANLGVLLIKTNRENEAQAVLEKVLKLDPA